MFQIILGILLIPVAFIIGVISPAPIGILFFGAGVALILRNSRWARRRYLFYTRHHPRVRRAVDIGLRRGRGRGRGQVRGGKGNDAPPASLTKSVSDPTSPTMPQA